MGGVLFLLFSSLIIFNPLCATCTLPLFIYFRPVRSSRHIQLAGPPRLFPAVFAQDLAPPVGRISALSALMMRVLDL